MKAFITMNVLKMTKAKIAKNKDWHGQNVALLPPETSIISPKHVFQHFSISQCKW
jgi:hypothetical protein